MSRQRTIVGIGDAWLAEFSDRTEPGGLALDAARHAARLGHRGIPISRLGQDALANELLTQLTALEIDTTHLQSDPDLPTARLRVQRIAGRERIMLDPRAAFDHLQWDFDLIDVAHRTDAVFCGLLAQRTGQCSSVITRFFSECRGALRIADLRSAGGADIERAACKRLLELSSGVMLSRDSLRAMRVDSDDPVDAVVALRNAHDLDFALLLNDGDETPMLVTDEGETQASSAWRSESAAAGLVALVMGFLDGRTTATALALASRIAEFTAANAFEPVPEEMIRAETTTDEAK